MSRENSDTINVYVANLGKYNEGYLQGAWIELPKEADELTRILHDKVGVAPGTYYEEYAIHDYEYEGVLENLCYRPSEYEGLYDLNILAKCAEVARDNGADLEVVGDWVANACGTTPSVTELCNLLLQADEIPYYEYSCKGSTPEESFGRSWWFEYMADRSDFPKLSFDIEDFIDFECLGKYMGDNCYLGENGYLDACQNGPSLDWYSKSDIEEIIDDQWQPPKQSATKQKHAHVHVQER